MRIPSDIKVPVQTPRSGVLEALGLRVGQVFTGEVIGKTPGGATTIQLGNQQITLTLPSEPQLGQILQFEVKTAGPRLELILLANSAKPQTAQPPAPGQPQGQVQNPAAVAQNANNAAIVQSSSAQPPPQQNGQQQSLPRQSGQSSGQPQGQPAPPGPQTSSPSSARVSVTSPLPAPSASTGPGSSPAAASPAAATPLPQGAIQLPQSLQSELNLQPGQLVTARVASPAPNGQPQIAIGTQQVPATLQGHPPPGTVLQFQVEFSGGEPRLVPLGQSPAANQPGASAQSPVNGQAPQSQANAAPSGNAHAPGAASAKSSLPFAVAASSAPVSQALAQTASTSVARQDSLGALIASLTGLKNQSAGLPSPVAEAASRVLGTQIDLGKGAPSAELLRNAVGNSGVFLEAMLARGQPVSANQGDMKAVLLLLRNALGNWLEGDDAQLPPAGRRPPPPMRGATPRSHPQNHPPLPDGLSQREAGRHLLSQTDSALSRLRLFQLSSLPEGAARATPGAPQEWNFELPFVIGKQMSMAQFQISRDANPDGGAGERGWQMIFSINLNKIGEVGAKVSYRARKTGVMLWAGNEETAEMLENMLPELILGLTVQGLEPGSVRVRRGAPETPPPRSGGFVDSVS